MFCYSTFGTGLLSLAAGTNLNGSVTGLARWRPQKEPIQRQEQPKHSTVSRSKSFPWKTAEDEEYSQTLPLKELERKPAPTQVICVWWLYTKSKLVTNWSGTFFHISSLLTIVYSQVARKESSSTNSNSHSVWCKHNKVGDLNKICVKLLSNKPLLLPRSGVPDFYTNF